MFGKLGWEVLFPGLRGSFYLTLRSFIISKVGNGSNVRIWVDNWYSLGQLGDMVSNRNITSLGSSLDARVRDVICNGDGDWNWPCDLVSAYLQLGSMPVPMARRRRTAETTMRRMRLRALGGLKEWKSSIGEICCCSRMLLSSPLYTFEFLFSFKYLHN